MEMSLYNKVFLRLDKMGVQDMISSMTIFSKVWLFILFFTSRQALKKR